MQIHPLYISVGVEYDGYNPGLNSMATLSLSVVNQERDRPSLNLVLRPVDDGLQIDIELERLLSSRGLMRERRLDEGQDPFVAMAAVIDWIDDACWLNYRPVLVSPDGVGALFVQMYLEKYGDHDPFDNEFVEFGLRASSHLEPFHDSQRINRSAAEKAFGQARELRRLLLLQPTLL